MVVDRLFFAYRRPGRICLAGPRHLDCFRVRNGRVRHLFTQPTTGIMSVPDEDSSRLAQRLGRSSWGVLLRSDAFIFNIFEFEALPRSEAKRLELAEWRLQKVFPEDISRFIHRVFHLGGRRLLSVLLPLAEAERVEAWFRDRKVSLVFLGNSTMELMNRLWSGPALPGRRRNAQVLVELDHQLGVAVFQEGRRPYYIRKFRCDSQDAFRAEMDRTLEYVQGNYGRVPRTVAYHPGRPAFPFSALDEMWRSLKLDPLGVPDRGTFHLHGEP